MATCKQCNKTFKEARCGKNIFCTLSCYHKSMVGKSHGHKTCTKAWNKGMKFPELMGEAHFAWKGENVSYRNLHRWVERLIGKPNKCTECGKVGYERQMHWANKSRTYKRELTDWVRLCVKCHRAYDRNLLVLTSQ